MQNPSKFQPLNIMTLNKKDLDTLVMQEIHDLTPDQRRSWLDDPSLIGPDPILDPEQMGNLGYHDGLHRAEPNFEYSNNANYRAGWEQAIQDKRSPEAIQWEMDQGELAYLVDQWGYEAIYRALKQFAPPTPPTANQAALFSVLND